MFFRTMSFLYVIATLLNSVSLAEAHISPGKYNIGDPKHVKENNYDSVANYVVDPRSVSFARLVKKPVDSANLDSLYDNEYEQEASYIVLKRVHDFSFIRDSRGNCRGITIEFHKNVEYSFFWSKTYSVVATEDRTISFPFMKLKSDFCESIDLISVEFGSKLVFDSFDSVVNDIEQYKTRIIAYEFYKSLNQFVKVGTIHQNYAIDMRNSGV
jgi:hypothetical protein